MRAFDQCVRFDHELHLARRNVHPEVNFFSALLAGLACCGVVSTVQAESISVGESHAAATYRDGRVITWGANSSGQLGNGSRINSSIPVPVTGLSNIARVSAGGNHTLALDTNHVVWSWGSNQFGQLGTLFGNNTFTPDIVAWDDRCSLDDTVSIGAGYDFSLAMKADGTVCTWGQNRYGQLGDGSSAALRSTPTKVGNLTNVIAVSAGDDFAAALKQDGTVWAWGNNNAGQLGGNQVVFANSPVRIPGLANITAITAGTCGGVALDNRGMAWAWGTSGNAFECLFSSLGVNSQIYAARMLPGLDRIMEVAAGAKNLAMQQDGSVWIHDGSSWTQKSDLPRVQSVASGSKGLVFDGANFALQADGIVWSWGDNFFGELGDGTFVEHEIAGLVVNETGDGPLDLAPDVANNIPLNKLPSFFLRATGGIPKSGADGMPADPKASVSATIKFNLADIGKQGNVYVTAMVPVGTLVAASKNVVTGHNPNIARDATAPGYVLVQLTASGWQAVVNNQFIPLASGVLGEHMASQKIADSLDTTALGGTEFCIGYGTSAPNMATAGLMRAVASVPSDSGSITVSCTDATIGAIVKPLNNCLFNWAEVTLPSYFSPRTESLSSGLYYFRAYSNTSAYLGVSSNRLLYLGPESANNMLDLGPALTWFTTAGCLG